MRLDEWLKKRQLTQKQFAEQLGVNQSQISRMCGAKPKWPAARLMRKVVIATGDEVTPYDWMFPGGPDKHRGGRQMFEAFTVSPAEIQKRFQETGLRQSAPRLRFIQQFLNGESK